MMIWLQGLYKATHDLSGLETCLGNVCCTKRVFMYVARHYRCILIRFSKPSQVCTPKKGKRLAGPPKQSNRTFAKKNDVVKVFFFFLWGISEGGNRCVTLAGRQGL